MKKAMLCALLLTLALLFAACGAAIPAAAPEPTPEPTPEPVSIGSLTLPFDAESLDLAAAGASLEELMSVSDRLTALRSIDLGLTEGTLAQIRAVQTAFPSADVHWKAAVLGEEKDESTETLDLCAATDADAPVLAEAIARLPELRSIRLAPESEGLTQLSGDSLALLSAAAPQAELLCRFELFGRTADWTTEALRYENEKLGDESIAAFRAAMPYLPALRLLRLENCGIADHEAMAALRDEFPEVKVVWTVYLSGYPFMTDTTMIHFDYLHDEDGAMMKYLTDVEALDVGHDHFLTNLEFVRDLPKLKIVIISLTNLSDISPFEACPDIYFFECFSTPVDDISVLAKLEKLEYLNLGDDPFISDVSALYDLKNLKIVRFVDNTRLSQAQLDELQQRLPDTYVSTRGGHSANSGNWRFNDDGSKTEMYAKLREIFMYDLSWIDSQSNSPSREG